ncbi:MAG: manganese efflux pump MntP family protein [Paludibacter sp.]|nr:manganese efflux pump MntP family protein [Paludibacter sp.]
MSYPEIILIALGLSFDTFAVSVSTGLMVKKIHFLQGVKIALVLAFFQSLLPFLGWLGGSQVVKYIAEIDHWFAFVLLSIVAIKMIIDAVNNNEEKKIISLSFRVLILMGLATSIDAFVVGISLAFIDIKIYQSIIIIGITTFLAAMIGMLIGKQVKCHSGTKIEIIGGIILFSIGLKILIEHLCKM